MGMFHYKGSAPLPESKTSFSFITPTISISPNGLQNLQKLTKVRAVLE